MARVYQNGVESGSADQFDSILGPTIATVAIEYDVTDVEGETVPSPGCSRFGVRCALAQARIANLSEFYTRSHIYMRGTPSNDTPIWLGTGVAAGGTLFRYHPGNQNSDLIVFATSTGALKTYRGNESGSGGYESTVIDTTSAGVIAADTWYVHEVYVKIANSGGRFVQRFYPIGADPITVTDFTGDTQANLNTSGTFFAVGFAGDFDTAGQVPIIHDDIAINDIAGTDNNSWPGDTEIVAAFPTAMGTGTNDLDGTSEATNRYLNVDETTPSTTDYNSESVIGRYDLYTFTAADPYLSPGPVAVFARTSYPGSASTFKFVRKSGGTEFRSAAFSPTYTDMNETLAGPHYRILVDEEDPAGGAWTLATIEALEAGMEVATAQEIRLQAIHLEIDTASACQEPNCILLPSDGLLLVDATSGDVVVDLSSGEVVGQVFYIKRIDESNNSVTLDPSPLQIDNLDSLALEPYDAVQLVTDGSAWWRL